MCILFVAHSRNPSSKYRLIVASNRDEVFSRPSRSAHFWEEEQHAHVLAGKDLTEGAHNGTWLGVTTDGKFAVLTNFSDRNADAAESAKAAKKAHSPTDDTAAGLSHDTAAGLSHDTAAGSSQDIAAGSSQDTAADQRRSNSVSPVAVVFALISAAFLSRVLHNSLLTFVTTCVVFAASHRVARHFPLRRKSVPATANRGQDRSRDRGSSSPTEPTPKIISRGGLARNFLCAPKGTLSAAEYMEALRQRAGSYNGFNLICGDRDDLLYFTNRTNELQVESLSDSVHGVSNSHLGEFPKVRRGVRRFRKLVSGEISHADSKEAHSCVAHNKHPHSSGDVDIDGGGGVATGAAVAHIDSESELIESLMDLLSDRSGAKEDEKLALKDVICVPHHVIAKGDAEGGTPDVWYGTRTHTVVLMKPSGEITFVERDYDIEREEWDTKVFRIDPSEH